MNKRRGIPAKPNQVGDRDRPPDLSLSGEKLADIMQKRRMQLPVDRFSTGGWWRVTGKNAMIFSAAGDVAAERSVWRKETWH